MYNGKIGGAYIKVHFNIRRKSGSFFLNSPCLHLSKSLETNFIDPRRFPCEFPTEIRRTDKYQRASVNVMDNTCKHSNEQHILCMIKKTTKKDAV